MQWTLQTERIWSKAHSCTWELVNEAEDAILIYDSAKSREINDNIKKSFPLVFAVGQFLVESYLPSLMSPLREHHLCTQEYHFINPDGGFEHWILATVETPPTAHERLEAALSLRQWLQSHASPEEMRKIERFIKA